jgi:hypothetical protein
MVLTRDERIAAKRVLDFFKYLRTFELLSPSHLRRQICFDDWGSRRNSAYHNLTVFVANWHVLAFVGSAVALVQKFGNSTRRRHPNYSYTFMCDKLTCLVGFRLPNFLYILPSGSRHRPTMQSRHTIHAEIFPPPFLSVGIRHVCARGVIGFSESASVEVAQAVRHLCAWRPFSARFSACLTWPAEDFGINSGRDHSFCNAQR